MSPAVVRSQRIGKEEEEEEKEKGPSFCPPFCWLADLELLPNFLPYWEKVETKENNKKGKSKTREEVQSGFYEKRKNKTLSFSVLPFLPFKPPRTFTWRARGYTARRPPRAAITTRNAELSRSPLSALFPAPPFLGGKSGRGFGVLESAERRQKAKQFY